MTDPASAPGGLPAPATAAPRAPRAHARSGPFVPDLVRSVRMPRAREFDEGGAVQRATRVFWDLGYHGASMSAILRATGLSRSSLYQTFGGKRALFLRTIEAYVEEARARQRRTFTGAACFTDGVAAYLGSRLAPPDRGGPPPGCYLTTLSASLQTGDRELRRIVQDVARAAEREVGRAFEAALAAGEVSRRLDAAAWTRLFLGLFWGLHVAARMGRPREEQAEMIAAFLRLLKGDETP